MSRLLLVRHCESSGQHGDAPLTARGLEQADSLAGTLAAFGIERIVSSPYLRARQTIEPFARRVGLAIEVDQRLQERRLSLEPIPDWRDFVRASFDDAARRAPGGESGAETLARGRAALHDALAHGAKLTALVGHGQHLSLLIHSIDGRFGYAGWERLSNPDLYLIESNGRGELRYARAWEGPS
jgi:2,3-bisphosphoglycerate-dependent phosphoglycerate mutase